MRNKEGISIGNKIGKLNIFAQNPVNEEETSSDSEYSSGKEDTRASEEDIC